MSVWVIACNDSIEHVYIGSESGARAKMDELASEDFKKQESMWIERALGWYGSAVTAYDAYRKNLHWHINKIDVSTEVELPHKIDFMECSICDAKPGSPLLCNSCLNNRFMIDKMDLLIRSIKNGT